MLLAGVYTGNALHLKKDSVLDKVGGLPIEEHTTRKSFVPVLHDLLFWNYI